MVNFKISEQHINPQAIEACRILHNNGYQAFLVGGCIRDIILGEKPKDYDITTDALPQKVMELFPKHYPTGLQHGTVTVAIGENHFEVTTFRIEGEYKDGRRPEEVFFVMNIEQDLARRDLTINAIAYDPIEGRIVDPFGGILDLQSAIIKAVGDAECRFKEDGLRIMRVARFAARFGYAVEELTFKALNNNLDSLKKVSKERIKDELSKTLMTINPSYGFLILEQSGALAIACPFLTNKPDYYLNFIQYLNKCQGELETRLAYLYCNYPLNEVQQELINIKFSNKEIKKTIFLLQLLEKFQIFAQRNTALAYKSFMAVIKNHSYDTWETTLEQFIILTEAMGLKSGALCNKYQEEIVFSKREMKINGEDLIAIGIKQGPEIKNILENCYLEILRNPEHNNPAFLLKFIMKQ